jgi:hypothetical protein
MRETHRLSAMALGMLLCSAIPAATYAQDKTERFEEQPQIVVDHSLEAVTAALHTAATSVAAGKVARGNVASRAGIYVQLLTLPPLGGADSALADAVERSDRTEIIVTLTEVPPDVVGPSLIAEIHEGTCLDLESGPVRASEEAAAGYSLTPSAFSSRSFGAVLPVSLATLRSSAHAVTVRAGPEEGISAFACIDVA